MVVAKWAPIKELDEMKKEMERVFDEVFEPRRRTRWVSAQEPGIISPNMDVFDRKNEIVIRTELPGVEKEGIDLTITNEALTVKGDVKKGEEVPPESFYMRERIPGGFARTVSLPVEVDSEKARASFKNGVLEIVLPKKEEAKPKEIKINIG